MPIMYDSESPADIPANPPAIAGYAVDGESGAWTPADWARFPMSCRRVVICRRPIQCGPAYPGGAVMFDVENGAGKISEIPGWLTAQRAAVPGALSGVYIEASQWTEGILAVHSAGIPQPPWWVASWGSPAVVLGGSVATQYASPSDGSPGDYDISVTLDTWPPPPPGGAVTPPSLPVCIGVFATKTGHGYWLVGSDGGVLTLGDAPFHGSCGLIHPDQPADPPGTPAADLKNSVIPVGPITGFASLPDDSGYWLCDALGGVYAFGAAQFYGSSQSIGRPV